MHTNNIPATRQRNRFRFADWNGTRVVVAGQAQAWLFDINAARKLTQVGMLADAKARLHDRDLAADRPGRVFDHAAPPGGRRGAVAHHAADGERSPHRHRATSFARRIAATLDRDRRQNRFRQVVLIAGPAFLGMLREAIKGPLDKMVVGHASVDLMHRPVAMAQAEVEAMLARGEFQLPTS